MPIFSNQSPLLKVGSPAPDFTLPNQNGQEVHLKSLLAQQWVVLFFYPKDHSPICTSQMCAFRNAYDEFKYAGAELIGISADSVASHQLMAENHQLPFQLLSDPDNQVRQAYGVPKTFGLIPGRVTYVIDPHGIIQMVYPSQFSAKAHMEKAMALLKRAGRMPH